MSSRGERSYDDPCGIARALDRVGERWALLLIRELIFGPKRFTDLRRGLPGASQNVLTQRLRELERDGIVERVRLGPPAGSRAYRLTDLGRGLEPVLLALAAWGSDLPIRSGGELSVDALMFALRATYQPRTPPSRPITYEVSLDPELFRITLDGDQIDVARGAATEPDTVITTSPDLLRDLVYAGRPLEPELKRGEIMITGNRQAAKRLFTSFRRPPRPS
ncbi:winged helix-turn-helix transcriptional regulator [Microlunatus speluncae]|uniref:winged helix-turn-helix transcriptional regulator n=1 Tax=Microlunatus speluncae TaxID=2594267 RepID=UPI0012661267|nr:helix-turn-helix domain-containing protein [Microlunatus speluncae]